MLTDKEIIDNEHKGGGWEAYYPNSIHFFDASSKKEAKRIATEYGIRFGAGRLLLIQETVKVKEMENHN